MAKETEKEDIQMETSDSHDSHVSLDNLRLSPDT